MKKFYCLFPHGKNIHLIKDVGMIPYTLHKEKLYEAHISFYEQEENLPSLKTDVNGLIYDRIKNFFSNDDIDTFFFLLTRFWKIDVLMMFHPSFKKVLIACFFKIITFNRIKFYFKLDMSEKTFENDQNPVSSMSELRKFFYRKAGLFTVETNKVKDLLDESSFVNVKYLPNGFNNESSCQINSQKKNIILTVGRIGSFEKDTDTLLRALSNVDLQNWEVNIVGPIETEYHENITQFYRSNPLLLEKVKFIGNISDRKILNEYYKEAKVFVLTSRFESFGLVYAEALSQGCYIISTRLAPAYEITSGEKYGFLFDIADDAALSSKLSDVISGKDTLPEYQKIMSFANTNYDWSVIVRKLHSMLEG
ncbi:glycosyltransferase [Sphingobacterium corticis]|uniref:Glycosyltransferase n=1 Tax=Sphingobacterium corticis TaxID=1812823 RepID=A0ABW5NJ67_9SPHI